MNILRQAARRPEPLDKVAKPLAGAVGRAVRPRVVGNLPSGTDLGHPLHPVLTDVPVGAWVMSALLDAAGGPAAEGAAELLVTAGVAAAAPTAAAGLNHWSDTAGPEARVGLVHAAVNTTALSLYLASVSRALGGRRRGGQVLGLAGLGCCRAAGTWEWYSPRWLHHLPMARQHLPVRRWQHRAQPGQHGRAQLPDAHPEGRIEVRAFI